MRVIAGKAKGHPLRSIESRSVRPTSDKVKGAIFSMLEAEAYKRCLAEPGYLLMLRKVVVVSRGHGCWIFTLEAAR